MIRIQCEACGSTELKKSRNMYICEFCGSKYLLDNQGQEQESILTDTKVVALLEESKKLHESNQYSKELNVLAEAVKLDDSNSTILVHLGRCYRNLSNPDRALEFYNKAIEINPYEGTAYTNMGTIYLLREQYEKARQSYEKGLPLIDKCEFDHWVAYANYAVAVAKLGNPEKAEKMVREAESRGYKNGDAVRKMAGIEKKSLLSRLFG